MMADPYIHPTADVASRVALGEGTRVWQHCQIREGAVIGRDCILGKGVYVDAGVHIGHNVKIQNYALVYHGTTIEDGVFIGPHVTLTNDKIPRAITPTGTLKGDGDWHVGQITVRYGASVGTGAIVLPGVTIGRFAMVGAGAVTTHDVPDFGLVIGQPARLIGYVCRCGQRLVRTGTDAFWCVACEEGFALKEGEL